MTTIDEMVELLEAWRQATPEAREKAWAVLNHWEKERQQKLERKK